MVAATTGNLFNNLLYEENYIFPDHHNQLPLITEAK